MIEVVCGSPTVGINISKIGGMINTLVGLDTVNCLTNMIVAFFFAYLMFFQLSTIINGAFKLFKLHSFAIQFFGLIKRETV